jgi:hypothetical protein
MIAAGSALFLGIFLGYRYRVAAALLASVVFAVFGVVESIVYSRSVAQTLLCAIMYVVCVQAGYIGTATALSVFGDKPRKERIKQESARLGGQNP